MTGSQDNDRNLVKRMLSGEEASFEEFFAKFFPGLYRFALGRVNQNTQIAEEVVQQTLTRAISKLATYRGEAALFTWLCTFCRHEISAYLRQQTHLGYQTEFIQDTPEIQAALESLLNTKGNEPEQILLRKEIARIVQLALDALPSHYSDALEWKYIEELSVKDIAIRMNLGIKATESLLTRAREAFRDSFFTVTSGFVGQNQIQAGGHTS
jgi:RNA polymerase sigma-70 factor, ECF subfamily